jgi:hypothetical protein
VVQIKCIAKLINTNVTLTNSICIRQIKVEDNRNTHHDAIADDGTVVGASAGAELRAEVRKREVTNKSQLCLPFSCVKMCSNTAGKNSRRRLGCH